MKKKWVVIVLLLLAAFVIWRLLLRFPGKEVDIPRLVPDSAAFYVEVKDVGKTWSLITEGKFWKGLIVSPLWKEARIEEKLAFFRQLLGEQWSGLFNRNNLMELVGKDFAVTLVSSRGGEGPVSLLVISRVSLKARAVELLARLSDRREKAGEQSLSEEEYVGRKLVSIKPTPSFPFFAAYTFIDDCLVAVLSQNPALPALQRVVDLAPAKQGLPSLAGGTDYRRARQAGSFAPAGLVEWYLRPDWLYRLGRKGVLPFEVTGYPSAGFDGGKLKKVVSELLPAFRTVAGQLALDGGVRTRLLLGMGEAGAEGRTPVFEEAAGPPAFRGLIPSGSLLYLSLRADLPALWGKSVKIGEDLSRPSGEGYLPALRKWEEDSGLRVAGDFLPWMGGKAAFLLEGVNTGLLPLPEMACILEVTDRRKASEAVRKLTEWLVRAHGLSVVRENYAGREVTLFSTPLLLQPGYFIGEDFIAISSSQELLRKMIDVARGEEAAVDGDPDFQKAMAKLDTSGEFLLYLNNERLIEESLEVGDWLLPMQKLMSGEPWIPEELYLQRIKPFLELCRVFKSFAANAGYRDGVVIQDAYWYIKDSPAQAGEGEAGE